MADAALTPPVTADALPTRQELETLFAQKHGPPEAVGWAPRRRLHFGYFLPADIYEALVEKLVLPGCAWLDVGGGHAVFPENPGLARRLASRCAKLVAVDPSENVLHNGFAHERVRCMLEEYAPEARFDLATARMVVEHVGAPADFVNALARLLTPGGAAVVFTVNRRSPIALLSWLLPFRLHHPIKRLFWGGEEADTFPTRYLMNTRAELRRLFEQAGFEERAFAKPGDLSLFGRFRWLNALELRLWSGLQRVGLTYPENCLIGVYRKR